MFVDLNKLSLYICNKVIRSKYPWFVLQIGKCLIVWIFRNAVFNTFNYSFVQTKLLLFPLSCSLVYFLSHQTIPDTT